jgi:hypothetical protein
MVYCQKDYEEKHATRCAGCSQYISGTVMHVMEKDWFVARPVLSSVVHGARLQAPHVLQVRRVQHPDRGWLPDKERQGKHHAPPPRQPPLFAV